MAESTSQRRETTARRVGMTVLVIIIAWTITAVTIGVLRGSIDEPPATVGAEG